MEQQYLEESPDRALFSTSGVSSAETGTSGTPESTLDSLSDTPSFSTLSSPSEPWQSNRQRRNETLKLSYNMVLRWQDNRCNHRITTNMSSSFVFSLKTYLSF